MGQKTEQTTHSIQIQQMIYYEVDIEAGSREEAEAKALAAIEDDTIEDLGLSEKDNGSFEIAANR